MSVRYGYDLCIIGAGSAGLSVAAGAVQLGLKVALIEQGDMGGDCLNTGCVPSKSLLAAAKARHQVEKAAAFGIFTDTPQIDFGAVKEHIASVIASIAPHDSEQRFTAMGVTVIKEQASFMTPHKIKAGNQIITAKKFVIATGSRPAIPPITGLDTEKILTHETLFKLEKRPEHLLIIGGGPIGTEMAQGFARLGSKVSLFDKGKILPKDDMEAVSVLRQALEEDHIDLYEEFHIQRLHHGPHDVKISIEDKSGSQKEISGTHILIAAGRKPSIDGLDLDRAGVKYNARGIITDRHLRSAQKHIYAAGDIVADSPQFTHVASYHAGIIIKHALFKLPAKTDYRALPWVTYTDPELAQAGLTEKMARAQYGDRIKVISLPFSDNDRARTENEPYGFIKIITTRKDRLIGATIAGPHAGELIGLWALAIEKKMKASAMAGMIAPYPTYGEISKHVAGTLYKDALFSEKTKKLVRFLWKLPF